MALDRRDFLKRAGLVGGAAAAATALPGCRRLFDHLGPGAGFNGRGMLELPGGRVQDRPRRRRDDGEPVVRPLARLARRGSPLPRRRAAAGTGGDFGIDGRQHQVYPGTDGPGRDRAPASARPTSRARSRAAAHADPGHGWDEGRAQRDGGFLAPGSDNDVFATGYYLGEDLPFTSQLAPPLHHVRPVPRLGARPDVPEPRVPALGPVRRQQDQRVPARGRVHLGHDLGPPARRRRSCAATTSRTCRSSRSGVPASATSMHPAADYFADCAAGTLPAVSLLDPRFLGPEQCDDHPLADIRRGQAFLRDAFKAFAASPQLAAGACSSSRTTSGAASSTTSGRRTSSTTARARSTRTTSARPGSACRPSWRRRSPVRASSTTARTSTARCCGSWSGASSAPRRKVPGTRATRGSSPARPQREQPRRQPVGAPLLGRPRLRPQRLRGPRRTGLHLGRQRRRAERTGGECSCHRRGRRAHEQHAGRGERGCLRADGRARQPLRLR